MSRFVKRDTVRTLEILDNAYEVDFGKDLVLIVFNRVKEETKAIEENALDDMDALERQKAVFKTAINDIIGNQDAAKQIFE